VNALVLAVLLLADPAVPESQLAAGAPEPVRLGALGPVVQPLALPERVFEAGGDRLDRGFFRVTLGGGGVSGLSGVSPTVLVGVEVSPWRHVGLRGGMGMVTATGGGAWTSVELSAAVVYHALPGAFLDPYVAAGAQVGVLSIYQPADSPPISFATSSGEPVALPDSTSGRGPVNSFAAPELQVGVNTKLRGSLGLDIGVRYLPLTYQGQTRSAFTGLVTLCTPF